MSTSQKGDNEDDNTLTCVPDDEERKTVWKKKCALCTGDYRRPKILPCKNFHTFCDDCIQFVAATWQTVFKRDPQRTESSARKDKDANMSFPCPRCRTMVQKPDEGFAENEYVKDADPEDKDTRKAYCLLCDNNNTVRWACSKCMLMMCDHCQHYHQLFSDEEHILDPLQSEVNAAKPKVQYVNMNKPRFDSPSYDTQGATAIYAHKEDQYEVDAFSPHVYDYDRASVFAHQPRQSVPPLPPRTKELTLPRVNALAESFNHSEDDYDAVCYVYPMTDQFPLKSGKIDSKPSSSATAADTVVYNSVVGKVPSWLPRPTEQTFKWSKAKVSSVCSVGKKVFIFGQVTEKRKEPSLKMAVFEAGGRKLLKAPMTSHVTSMALLEAGQDKRLVLVQQDSPCLQWINAQENSRCFLSSSGEVQLSDVRQVYVKNPVLSKPTPGQPLYVLGISDEGETEVYKVLTKRSTPPLHLPYEGTVQAIDVSSDDKYVAVLGTQGRDLAIDVYERSGQKAIHVSGFSFDDKAGSCDICFYIPKGAQQEIGEVLMVAERYNSCLRLLDHVTNCRPVGKLPVDSPVCFTKSDKGQLWLVCDPKPDEVNILVF